MKKLTLREENEFLKKELNIRTGTIVRLTRELSKIGFNGYIDIEDNLKELISDRQRVVDILKKNEGLVDRMGSVL